MTIKNKKLVWSGNNREYDLSYKLSYNMSVDSFPLMEYESAKIVASLSHVQQI